MPARNQDAAAATAAAKNPDSLLPWAEMVSKVVAQSQEIVTALTPLAQVNRDADGKEIKPIQDKAGLNAQTARALKAEFRKRQKQNGGGYDLGDETATKAHTLRTKLEQCLKLAQEVAQDAHDCQEQAALLAKMYAQANQPKIKAKAERAKKSAAAAAKRAADLEAQLQAN